MMSYVGKIYVALNHETDKNYSVRIGEAYKCPKCGCISIYKWINNNFIISAEDFSKIPFWRIFLEDHTHYNKFHALKI